MVIASLIWADVMLSPIRTCVSENKDKLGKVALLSVSGGGTGNKRVIRDLESLAGKKVTASLLLARDEFKQGNCKKLERFPESLTAATPSYTIIVMRGASFFTRLSDRLESKPA